jgi:hypothetical protein
MRAWVISAFASLACSTASAAEYAAGGLSETLKTYIDVSSRERQPSGHALVWSVWIYPKASRDFVNGDRYTIRREEFDCAGKSRSLAFATYGDNGDVRDSGDVPTHWVTIFPGSLGETNEAIACGRKAPSPTDRVTAASPTALVAKVGSD